MRNALSLYLIVLVGNLLSAQTNSELVYPVVPIADECHKALDNSDSIIIMSKEEFLQLDSLWTTFNTCYNYTDDTLWIKQFEIAFRGIINEVNDYSYSLVSDGNLQNEYLSSLQDSRKNIKQFDHIHIKNIQFEQYGGMYQVDNIHIVIDSLVVPQLDTCWRYFPMSPTGSRSAINITKDSFIALLTDSFGYNICSNKIEWQDTGVKVNMWIAPRSLVDHYTINSFINDYHITHSSDLTRPINEIKNLSYADIVTFRRVLYQKDDTYYYVPEYRFNISDQIKCVYTINVESYNNDSLTNVLMQIRNGQFKDGICFVNKQGYPISFKMVLVPQDGSMSMLSTGGGNFTPNMIRNLKKLESGDRVILEGLTSHDPYEFKKSKYKPIVIILP